MEWFLVLYLLIGIVVGVAFVAIALSGMTEDDDTITDQLPALMLCTMAGLFVGALWPLLIPLTALALLAYAVRRIARSIRS